MSSFDMTDLTVIILAGKEELHIKRCLERLAPLAPRQIFIVESQHGDKTHEIAVETGRCLNWRIWECLNGRIGECLNDGGVGEGCGGTMVGSDSSIQTFSDSNIPTFLHLVWHDWPGNQAAQFQWALDNLPIESEWILRLDADEYLTDELIAEIKTKLPFLYTSTPLHGKNINGVILKRRHMWRDVWVKRGMYPTRILRLFRKRHGKSDGKLMDEHIIVDGEVVEMQHDFVDHSLIPLTEWEAKHRNYAKREAQSFLSGEKSHGVKGKIKWCYYHLLPSFMRPAIYWFKRAIVNGAYFESPEARDFTYRHAFWYRTQVEREIKSSRRSTDFVHVMEEDYNHIHEMHKNDPAE